MRVIICSVTVESRFNEESWFRGSISPDHFSTVMLQKGVK